MNIRKIQKNKAFALLFAIILSSIILAISAGIAEISYKEILLTTSGKSGDDAFYAADVGAECALYLDKDSTTSPFESVGSTNYNFATNAQCAGLQVTPTTVSGADVSFILQNLGAETTGCAIVSVTKNTVIVPIVTTVISKGYNACTLGSPSSSNAVERELQVTY